jgi:CYTH domain-containing protein
MEPEIERKFLLNLSDLPVNIDALEHVLIDQGYIFWNEAGDESRLRKSADRYLLSFKTGSGISRTETEIELTKDQFDRLWPMTKGRRLRKTRYFLKDHDHLIEIDVYEGKAGGLVVAEVEFSNIADYKSFIPPGWFGREISEDESFRNRNLAVE